MAPTVATRKHGAKTARKNCVRVPVIYGCVTNCPQTLWLKTLTTVLYLRGFGGQEFGSGSWSSDSGLSCV